MQAQLMAVHPVLGAKDVAELVQFYHRLGFVLAFQDTATDPKYAVIRRDGVELHLQWADAQQWAYPIDRPIFRFLVDDVDALYDDFVKNDALGAPVGPVSPWASPANTPWWTREFHMRDPNQNGLQFYRPL